MFWKPFYASYRVFLLAWYEDKHTILTLRGSNELFRKYRSYDLHHRLRQIEETVKNLKPFFFNFKESLFSPIKQVNYNKIFSRWLHQKGSGKMGFSLTFMSLLLISYISSILKPNQIWISKLLSHSFKIQNLPFCMSTLNT